ncbi:MAG: hypothetical protein HKP59_08290 [Lutibacter sp.]|uniref:hypothetical protein n=1 Tax=Lutibacter sp. TaxID=1925666 RepID=UPI0017E37CF4|nr:hypothetical protein [Lutibacter sp.]MBT8317612.1 hypothetical protein [Lutibacter sp.]NNJ58471.1 hypothetical protein [Lutibacter sp.]
MIHYVKRQELDEEKYNQCIQSALNSRIYAYSWYLDCVADNWDALIFNDYEAVMPLPWRSKYFIKYVYPPAWTQQLGVFSKDKIEASLMKGFINLIPKKFKKVTIQFNSDNDVSFLKTTKRDNYILPLNKHYEDIYMGFNKNRKRDLKKALLKDYKIDEEISCNEFLDFYLNESKNYQLNKNQIIIIKSFLNLKNESVQIWGIRDNEKLIASLVWLKDENRVTYLLPTANNKAKSSSLPTLIISELIKQHSETNYIFDFEGSMIEGVADFYKSFGAIKENYYLYMKKTDIF